MIVQIESGVAPTSWERRSPPCACDLGSIGVIDAWGTPDQRTRAVEQRAGTAAPASGPRVYVAGPLRLTDPPPGPRAPGSPPRRNAQTLHQQRLAPPPAFPQETVFLIFEGQATRQATRPAVRRRPPTSPAARRHRALKAACHDSPKAADLHGVCHTGHEKRSGHHRSLGAGHTCACSAVSARGWHAQRGPRFGPPRRVTKFTA